MSVKNYQKIKNDILDHLLAKKRTSSVSHKMGFKFDKVMRWKNGTKQLLWNEFCDLCFVLKAPLLEALGFSLGALFVNEKEAYKILPFLKKFSKFRTNSDMAKQLMVSQATMQRYLSCEIYPSLEVVLECIDQRPHFLDHFMISLMCPADKIDQGYLTLPWASSVVNAMSLPQHLSLPEFSPSWIGQKLGLTESQVIQAIKLLEDIGLIELRGNHYGPTLSRTIAVRRETKAEEYDAFLKFWMERASRGVSKRNIDSRGGENSLRKDGFRVFTSSPESARKITEILTKTEQDIHEILQSDTNEKNEVRVFLFHHFSASDF